MKKLLLVASFLVILFFLGRNLNPNSSQMFTFHDSTQPARIQQFVLNLKQFKIPPRVAPDFNYGLGYPVFNFYAPTSYWITSIFNLVGFDVVSSLKLSFFLALIIGFAGSYLFLKNFFEFIPAVLGGFLYITSLYFPLNIFVRGNLAETWFLSIFPFGLYFIFKNSVKTTKRTVIFTAFILSFLFTVHNILSLISLPIIIVYILLLKNKKQNLISLSLAILLSAYFWIPALFEMKYTWAREVATSTNFRDHFLCINQIWQSQWGFGGSTKGCLNDGMSFMIGKIQLIFFALGTVLFLAKKSKNKYKLIYWFILLITTGCLFLTVFQSQPIWEFFSPLMSLIQFPWRLIGLSLLGIVFFSSYFFQHLNIPLKNLVLILIFVAILVVNGKYFHGQTIKKSIFESKYLSLEYIEKKSAYAVAEYLPKTIDYRYWRSLENKKQIPMEFIAKSSIEPFDKNKQTLIEKVSNIISLITLISLIILIWKTK